ncbi:EAL domain-containing protein [Lysobacter sp. TY2-98]|uniref:EAL domain-containing protein n=1 Tax=Lysobacter sp. TY2-98 TaxID=2290922 RepID=UPI0013B46269|nr:EAL domain-containing protein [Lysobacter sp. TY2-98]
MTSLGLGRSRMVWFAVALVVAAVAVPVVLSLLLAREQARVDQARRASIYASDVLRRSDDAGDQIGAAFRRLAATPDVASCGPAVHAVLQGIDVGSSYIQLIGLVRGDAIYCSSYGLHDPPIALGPVDYVSATRARVRQNVQLDFAAPQRFIVIDNGRFAAVVHKSLPVDSTVVEPGVSLAVASVSTGRVLATRGRFDRAWMHDAAALAPGAHRTFNVRGRTIAQYRSRNYDVMAIASLDAGNYNGALIRMARVLVPIGLALGLVLAYTTHHLARQQMSAAAAIRSGLVRNEFHVVYQPIVRLSDRRWVGAEVLLRWRRPDGSLVRPDLFIPVAEEAGLISAITERVIELVEPTLAQLAAREDGFFLSINFSPQDMHREGTLDLLRELLRRTGVQPKQVHVEVTERAFANTLSARDMVRRMRDLGLLVAIDDFGTGYSSLAELTTFELDALKIDKAFVDTVGSDAVTSHVAFHIVEMARGLSLGMVAEGVEQEGQAAILLSWRVPFGQGWLFSRPLPADELLARLPGVVDVDTSAMAS